MNIVRKCHRIYLSLTAVALLSPALARAQSPTSQEIHFDVLLSKLPFGSTQNVTVQVWDAATLGNMVFSEAHAAVKVGLLGNLDLVRSDICGPQDPLKQSKRWNIYRSLATHC
jgi:hypothetical protein